jgi:glycine betaine/proline transport system permease protein
MSMTMERGAASLPPPSASTKEEQPYIEPSKPRRTGWKLLGIVIAWVVLYEAFKGKWTKEIGLQDRTSLHDWINEKRDWVQLHGPDNWFLGGVLGNIGSFTNWLFTHLQTLISTASLTRPVPEIGWLGVVAIVAWLTFVAAGLRSTILVTLSCSASCWGSRSASGWHARERCRP